jgi:hypothetical protein
MIQRILIFLSLIGESMTLTLTLSLKGEGKPYPSLIFSGVGVKNS